MTDATTAAPPRARSDGIDTPSFLMALHDRLHGLSRPLDMIDATLAMVGDHLQVNRAGFVEIEHDSGMIHYAVGWSDGAVEPLTGRQSIVEQLGPRYVDHYRAGLTSYAHDTDNDPLGMPGALSAVGAKAMMAVPVLRDGEWVAGLFVNQATVRDWLPNEGALLEGAARYLWNAIERARVDFALAKAETERDVFWKHSRDLLCAMGGDGIVDRVNPAWTDTMGWGASDIVGRTLDWLGSSTDAATFSATVQSLDGEEATADLAYALRGKDGRHERFHWLIVRRDAQVFGIGRRD